MPMIKKIELKTKKRMSKKRQHGLFEELDACVGERRGQAAIKAAEPLLIEILNTDMARTDKIAHLYFAVEELLDRSKSRYRRSASLGKLIRLKDFIGSDRLLSCRSFLDFGAGKANPIGFSMLMYLNGVDRCFCVDQTTLMNPVYAAKANYNMLSDIALRPGNYAIDSQRVETIRSRIHNINIDALKAGDLDGALRSVGDKIIFVNSDIRDAAIEKNSIDIICSVSVLEHLDDVQSILLYLETIMSNDGAMAHFIDLRDHRARGRRAHKGFHNWSFLTDYAINISTNRVRWSEFMNIFGELGLVVEKLGEVKEDPPSDLRSHLREDFKNLSDEDLSIIRAKCLLIKSNQ
jgi:SAM-dependent methyltransferase